MFEDGVSDIKTRIEDRPGRPFPRKIGQLAEMPWLASKFNPALEIPRPTVKNVVGRIVSTGIPLIGTLGIVGAIGYIIIEILGFYAK